MLNRFAKRHILKALALVAIVYALSFLVPLHGYVNESGKYAGDAHKTHYDVLGTLLTVTILDALDNHGGAIAAVAGALVAWFTLTLKWSTDKLWQVADKQGKDFQASLAHAERTADAAVESNKITRELAVSAKRPWVSIDRVDVDAPPCFDGIRWNFPLRFFLWNHGDSPAEKIQIYISMINVDRTRVGQACDALRYKKEGLTSYFGQTIFPGRPYDERRVAILQADEVTNPMRSITVVGQPKPTNVFVPFVFGCVAYRNPLDAALHYKTGFCLAVSLPGNMTDIHRNASAGDTLKAGDVGLRREPSGWYAD